MVIEMRKQMQQPAGNGPAFAKMVIRKSFIEAGIGQLAQYLFHYLPGCGQLV